MAPLSLGENVQMTVDTPTHHVNTGPQNGTDHSNETMTAPVHREPVAGSSRDNNAVSTPRHDRDGHPAPGCSRWCSLSQERERRDDRQYYERDRQDERHSHENKGKARASYQELEWQREMDDTERQRKVDREEWDHRDAAHICAEHEPIPQHVIDMQMRDFEEHRPDPTANALHDQISINVKLMRRCEELEKLLNKRQLSPDGRQNQSSKRHRDSRPSPLEQ